MNEPLFRSIRRTIRKNGWLEIPARGTSMFPLIREGDVCHFYLVQEEQIKRGDVLLFYSESGHLVAHRLMAILEDGENGRRYVCKGDSNLGRDEPVGFERVLGVLLSIRRNGNRVIRPNSRPAVLWSRAVMAVPVISGVLKRFASRTSPAGAGEHTNGQVL